MARKAWKNGPVAPSPKYHCVESSGDAADAAPPPSVPPLSRYIARSTKIGTSDVTIDPSDAWASAGSSPLTKIVVRLCGGSVRVRETGVPPSIR
jgi:hypothetical protein